MPERALPGEAHARPLRRRRNVWWGSSSEELCTEKPNERKSNMHVGLCAAKRCPCNKKLHCRVRWQPHASRPLAIMV